MTAAHDDILPLLLNVYQTARALNVSERTVWALIASGALGSVQIGRRRLITLASIEQFIAERTNSQSQ